MRYGGISMPSFFFIVAWTSISVRTPNPTLLSSSVTRASARSKSSATVLPNVYWLIDSPVIRPARSGADPGNHSRARSGPAPRRWRELAPGQIGRVGGHRTGRLGHQHG